MYRRERPSFLLKRSASLQLSCALRPRPKLRMKPLGKINRSRSVAASLLNCSFQHVQTSGSHDSRACDKTLMFRVTHRSAMIAIEADRVCRSRGIAAPPKSRPSLVARRKLAFERTSRHAHQRRSRFEVPAFCKGGKRAGSVHFSHCIASLPPSQHASGGGA
jgi:hypothetical protein